MEPNQLVTVCYTLMLDKPEIPDGDYVPYNFRKVQGIVDSVLFDDEILISFCIIHACDVCHFKTSFFLNEDTGIWESTLTVSTPNYYIEDLYIEPISFVLQDETKDGSLEEAV